MTENMEKFLDAAAASDELAEAIGKAESAEALLSLAKDAGVTLTEEDLVLEAVSGEMSDEELDCVAGGMRMNDTQKSAVLPLNGVTQTDDFFRCLGGVLGSRRTSGAKASDTVYRGGGAQASDLVYHGNSAHASNLVHHSGNGSVSGNDLVSL